MIYQYTIEMLSYLELGDEPENFIIAPCDSDPGLQVGDDDVWVVFEVWGKTYDIKSKVVRRKKEIFRKGSNPNAEFREVDLLKLRIFLEPEDREMAIELAERLKKYGYKP